MSAPPAPPAVDNQDANQQLADSLLSIQADVTAEQATGSDVAIFNYVSTAHRLSLPEWRAQYDRWMAFVQSSTPQTVLPDWTRGFLSTSITASMYGCSIVPGVEYSSAKCQSVMRARINRDRQPGPTPPVDLLAADGEKKE